MRDNNGDDPFSRAISESGDIVVVSVEYGLAPDNKHPGLMHDCFKTSAWALRNLERLNTAEGKFIIAGLSAGGQLAFATALGAVDDGLGEGLVGVVGLIPATVHPDAVPEGLQSKYTAMEAHDQHTIITGGAEREFWCAHEAEAR